MSETGEDKPNVPTLPAKQSYWRGRIILALLVFSIGGAAAVGALYEFGFVRWEGRGVMRAPAPIVPSVPSVPSAPAVPAVPLRRAEAVSDTRIAQLAERVAALEADISARPAPGALVARAEITALANKVAALDAERRRDIADVSARVNAPSGSEFALLGLALFNLMDAAGRSGGFLSEYETSAALMPDDAALLVLRPYADAGAPTLAELTVDFVPMRDEVLDARMRDAGGGLRGWIVYRLYRVFRFRPVGERAGLAPEAVLARMETRLQRGDLAAAVGEAEALDDPAARAWRARAERRLAIDAGLLRLRSSLIARMRALIKEEAR